MNTPAIATVVKMLETLPEEAQTRVSDHLREYIQELQDEMKWDALFRKTQDQLAKATERADEEIAAGKSEPMDFSRL
ncbi:MAG TPA: hypothetical protein VI451_01575 [Anaerolineales bacterium]|nr:hypothetical protein [Anaerolineales bacterium]